ncbi:MAG: aminoglycoside phosphotransferase family protein [Halioglobus sp.]
MALSQHFNQNHLSSLCQTLSLGNPLRGPVTVTGGFHHTMWRLDTNTGSYALKQLSEDFDQNTRCRSIHFEATEAVARKFASIGIPAVSALLHNGEALQSIDEKHYLIYPWVDAKALHREHIDRVHVQEVAELLASMHLADIDIPDLQQQVFEVHQEEKLTTLVEFARSRNSSRAKELSEHLPLFLQQIARQQKAIAYLSAHSVTSHGDMDHKNVLWDSQDKPLIIDWESARKLNPTHEVILEALDWSGITLDFNETLFDEFVRAYLKAGGIGSFDDVEAALHCVIADWVNWLMYNVGRSIDVEHPEQRLVGVEQVDHALATLLRLERIVPRLLARLR